jgi:hypothetical protein
MKFPLKRNAPSQNQTNLALPPSGLMRKQHRELNRTYNRIPEEESISNSSFIKVFSEGGRAKTEQDMTMDGKKEEGMHHKAR